MLDKYLSFIGIAGLGLLIAGYFTISVPQEAARKDALTFSNTGIPDREKLAIAEWKTRYPAEIYLDISIPPPPKNSSAEVASELATLHAYTALRTSREIRDIFTEVNMDTAYFGGISLVDYMDEKKFPATALLLKDSFYDLGIIEMQQKKKFDRVRPSALDPSLETVIAVPGFSAYPSYHSSDSYFIAFVFSELAPAVRAAFMARASQIAHNREVAGVHYPSDTRAGLLLADQFFNILMKNEKFLKLLAAAKKEWSTHPELLRVQANP